MDPSKRKKMYSDMEIFLLHNKQGESIINDIVLHIPGEGSYVGSLFNRMVWK